MQLSPISLAITRLGGVRFSPSALFATGAQGVWYDPSDASTLFEDTAGTTPSPTPGAGALSVVGLMLDKSQGLALGSELNGDPSLINNGFWSVTDPTITVGSGKISFSSTPTANAAYKSALLTADKFYQITITIANRTTGGISIETPSTNGLNFNTNGTFTCRVRQQSSTIIYISSVGTTTLDITSISIRELPGNHAISYNTTTARPELSARVNLLTYSEQFDNAAWTKGNASVTANTSIAPDGTTTADTFTSTNTNAEHYLQPNAGASINTPNVNYTGSISVKAGTHNFVTLSMSSGYATAWAAITANLSTGQITKTGNGAAGTLVSSSIAPQGNNWYRVTFTASYASGGPGLYLWVSSSSSGTPTYGGYGVETWSAAGTETILLWGADLRPANIGASVPAYQRIADQYTYDSNGFPRYLIANGTATGMYTPNNLNLSGTDKVTVFAGVRKSSDATRGCVAELGNLGTPTTGSWFINAPLNGTANDYSFASAGTTPVNATYTNASVAAPTTNVLSGIGNIGAPVVTLRVNGVQTATSSASQGTGNFGSYPLYIGSRNNASLYFNGYLYSLVVVGAASTAAQISSTESWINVKEGGVY